MSEFFTVRRAVIVWDGEAGWLSEWREGRWWTSYLGALAGVDDLRQFCLERQIGFEELRHNQMEDAA